MSLIKNKKSLINAKLDKIEQEIKLKIKASRERASLSHKKWREGKSRKYRWERSKNIPKG